MAVQQTNLFAPPLRNSNVPDTLQKWFFTLQQLQPLVEGDTSKGPETYILPPAGLIGTTGQSNQNMEVTATKTTPDVNAFTIDGLAGQLPSGPVVLMTNSGAGSFAKFKSNGVLWRRVG